MVEKPATNATKGVVASGIVLQVSDLKNMKPNKENEEKKTLKKEKDDKNKGINTLTYVTMFFSEFIGTGLLLYLGCMGCITEVDETPVSHHMVALSFGLVILIIIQAFGHISGAHLNPAVSITALILKLLDPMMTLVYIAGQFAGAVVGFALLKISVPSEYAKPGLCLTLPHKLLSPIQAFLIELVITTVLVIVVCAVWDKRNADKADSLPLRFGLIVTAISMVAGPFTGASMNTVRTFAPALLAGNYDSQWIYWTAPNLAAILGCGIYKFLFALKEERKDLAEAEEVVSLEEVNDSKSKNYL